MVEEQAPNEQEVGSFLPAAPAARVVVTSTGHSVGGHRSCKSRDFSCSLRLQFIANKIRAGREKETEKKEGRERRRKIDFTPAGERSLQYKHYI